MGGAILGQAFREYLRVRRLWPWILVGLICFFVAFVWDRLDSHSTADASYSTVSAMLVFRLLALASAIFTTAIVSQEIEQKTIVYLLTRPIPRWRFLLLRYAASVTVVALVAVVAAILTSIGSEHGFRLSKYFLDDLPAFVLGACAYGALFLFVSLLFNRALVICALFAFGWESTVPDLPGNMYRLSIFSYLQAISGHKTSSEGPAVSLLTGGGADNQITPTVGYVTLLAMVVVLLALSAFWFTRFEYVPREDAE